jgi:hypothetical protein
VLKKYFYFRAILSISDQSFSGHLQYSTVRSQQHDFIVQMGTYNMRSNALGDLFDFYVMLVAAQNIIHHYT